MRDKDGFNLDRKGRREACDMHNVNLALQRLGVVASFEHETLTLEVLYLGRLIHYVAHGGTTATGVRSFNLFCHKVADHIEELFRFRPPAKFLRPAFFGLSNRH
jgi:hypothetical protein